MSAPDISVIEDLILSGMYREGTNHFLTEAKIIHYQQEANGTTISRTVVREMLASLASWKVVQQVAGVGTMFPKLSKSEFTFISGVRLDMEKQAVMALIGKIRDEPRLYRDAVLSQLKSKMDLMYYWASQRKVRAVFRTDSEFHCCIAELAGLDAARDMIRVLYLRTFLSTQDTMFTLDADLVEADREREIEERVYRQRKGFVDAHRKIYDFIESAPPDTFMQDGNEVTLEQATIKILNEHADDSVNAWSQAGNLIRTAGYSNSKD